MKTLNSLIILSLVLATTMALQAQTTVNLASQCDCESYVGTGAPTATSPAGDEGDIYFDEATGRTYTMNAAGTWQLEREDGSWNTAGRTATDYEGELISENQYTQGSITWGNTTDGLTGGTVNTGVNSAAGGTDNSVDGENSLVVGTINVEIGGRNIVGGQGNTTPGDYSNSLVSGALNSIDADNGVIVGVRNTDTGSTNIVSGVENTTSSTTALVTGRTNLVRNIVGGEGNTVELPANLVIGAVNQLVVDPNTGLSAGANVLNGTRNILNSTSRSMVTGTENILQTDNINSIIGGSLNTTGIGIDGSLIVGANNAVTVKQSLIAGLNNTIHIFQTLLALSKEPSNLLNNLTS